MTLSRFTLRGWTVRIAVTVPLLPFIALAFAADWYTRMWEVFMRWLDRRLPR